MNIALVNELAMLCDRMGIDIWEVIDAAAAKPYGFMPFYPGPGGGGHCHPGRPWSRRSPLGVADARLVLDAVNATGAASRPGFERL